MNNRGQKGLYDKMNTDKILRVALYPRVSTEDQVLRGDSLQAQEDALLQYAQENNMKVVKVYRDEGHSARKPVLKREVMRELLDDVAAGKIDRILFTKIDRWFRNVREYHTVQEILDRYGVTWQAILEDYSTASADGRLKVNIMLSVAENESDRLSERVRFVFNSKLMRKEVYFAGRVSPYGYKVVTEDGIRRLVKDEEKVEIVEEFFRLALRGSIRQAAIHVNKKYGLQRAYNKWHNMTKNSVYAGVLHGVEDFCEPYITKGEFAEISTHKDFCDRKAAQNRVYIFAGLLTCPGCGKRMAGKYTTGSQGVEYMYYRCAKKIAGLCAASTLSEIKIEKALLERVRKDLENIVLQAEVGEAAPKVKKGKSNVEKIQEKIRRLNVSYHAEAIDDEEYLAKSAELKAALALAKVEEESEAPQPDVEAIKEFLNTDFETIYETLDREEKKQLWRSIIKAIHLDENGVSSVTYRA